MNIGFDASRAFIKNRTGTENYSFQILSHLSTIDHTNNYYVYVRSGAEWVTDEVLTGGAEERSQESTAPRRKSGEDAPEIPEQQDPSKNSESHLWPSNFHFITIPYPRLWTQAGLARQTFKDPLDVLFIPAHTLPLVYRPGLKTVVTVHDLGAEYLPAMHQLKQRLYLNFMTHQQLKSATQLIAVSQATKKDLIKKVGLAAKNISVIHEGFDPGLFKPIKGRELIDTLWKYQLHPRRYFLFVGTIQPRKNLERLIKAYAEFLKKKDNLSSTVNLQRSTIHHPPPIVKLIIVGSNGWQSEEIYQLPQKLGIEKHVRFLGFVPDERLPALYSGALGFLYPSLFEGFGLPILEAFACHCPVLTSNLSSMPEVAGEAALLVNPYSVEEICQGMNKILNEELREELMEKEQHQLEKFSWEKCARETLQVLEQAYS